jgi:hypothetical protein
MNFGQSSGLDPRYGSADGFAAKLVVDMNVGNSFTSVGLTVSSLFTHVPDARVYQRRINAYPDMLKVYCGLPGKVMQNWSTLDYEATLH